MLSHLEDIYSIGLLNCYICTTCINCLKIMMMKPLSLDSPLFSLLFFPFYCLRKFFWNGHVSHLTNLKIAHLTVFSLPPFGRNAVMKLHFTVHFTVMICAFLKSMERNSSTCGYSVYMTESCVMRDPLTSLWEPTGDIAPHFRLELVEGLAHLGAMPSPAS